MPRRHEAAADSGRMPCRSREPAAPLGTHEVAFEGLRPCWAQRERTRHAANGAEDEPLGAAAAGAEPRQHAVRHEAAAAGFHHDRCSHNGGGGSAAWKPPMRTAGCLLAAACGRSASRRMRPAAAGMPSIPHSGEGEAGGAANAAPRGAARGRGASRCRMRRRAPFPLMSPPQRPASRASRCSEQREGRMPDLRFVVFAARRKPPPTSWSRAARAGGHRALTLVRPGRIG